MKGKKRDLDGASAFVLTSMVTKSLETNALQIEVAENLDQDVRNASDPELFPPGCKLVSLLRYLDDGGLGWFVDISEVPNPPQQEALQALVTRTVEILHFFAEKPKKIMRIHEAAFAEHKKRMETLKYYAKQMSDVA